MQDIVRHHNQVRRLQLIADRRDERAIQLAKMRFGCRLQLLAESTNVIGP